MVIMWCSATDFVLIRIGVFFGSCLLENRVVTSDQLPVHCRKLQLESLSLILTSFQENVQLFSRPPTFTKICQFVYKPRFKFIWF